MASPVDQAATLQLAPTTSSTIREPVSVRKVALAELKPAAYALAEAFATDAVARYFLDTPDRTHWTPAQKWALHVSIIEYITAAHMLGGAVTAAGPDYGCVALWLPPGGDIDGLATFLRSGMWRLHYKLSREGRTRFFTEFLPLLHDTKRAVLGEARDHNSWYLVYLGTRPGARGRGYARASVEWGAGKADAAGQPVYLESSSKSNLPIYRRMGFEVVRQIELVRALDGGMKPRASVEGDSADGGKDGESKNGIVVLDIMVREPVNYSNGQHRGATTIVESRRELNGTTVTPAYSQPTIDATKIDTANINATKIHASATVLQTHVGGGRRT